MVFDTKHNQRELGVNGEGLGGAQSTAALRKIWDWGPHLPDSLHNLLRIKVLHEY